MKDVYAAKFDGNYMGVKETRPVSGGSKRVATVTLWVQSAEKLYLAMRKDFFLGSMIK